MSQDIHDNYLFLSEIISVMSRNIRDIVT